MDNLNICRPDPNSGRFRLYHPGFTVILNFLYVGPVFQILKAFVPPG